jgi:hypothetical protein
MKMIYQGLSTTIGVGVEFPRLDGAMPSKAQGKPGKPGDPRKG